MGLLPTLRSERCSAGDARLLEAKGSAKLAPPVELRANYPSQRVRRGYRPLWDGFGIWHLAGNPSLAFYGPRKNKGLYFGFL